MSTTTAVLGALAVAGMPTNLARLGAHVWVNNHHPDLSQRFLLKVRADDLTVAARYVVKDSISHAVSERWFFVAGVGCILQRRISDGSLVTVWAAGPRPDALLFDGVNLWAADGEDDTVSMVSGRSLAAADAP